MPGLLAVPHSDHQLHLLWLGIPSQVHTAVGLACGNALLLPLLARPVPAVLETQTGIDSGAMGREVCHQAAAKPTREQMHLPPAGLLC